MSRYGNKISFFRIFLIVLFCLLVLSVIAIVTALLITASVQNVSPAVQWHNWMIDLGFIKKAAETTANMRWLL